MNAPLFYLSCTKHLLREGAQSHGEEENARGASARELITPKHINVPSRKKRRNRRRNHIHALMTLMTAPREARWRQVKMTFPAPVHRTSHRLGRRPAMHRSTARACRGPSAGGSHAATPKTRRPASHRTPPPGQDNEHIHRIHYHHRHRQDYQQRPRGGERERSRGQPRGATAPRAAKNRREAEDRRGRSSAPAGAFQ